MAEPHQATVYLVDDHELVRDGLRALLEDAGFAVVGEAATVDEAVTKILGTRPAVAILDVRLADGSGIDVCRRITQHGADTACLMLTSYDDNESLFDAIAAGASGYLLKQIRNLELVDAIRRVANGERLLDSKATERVLERLRFGPHHDPLLATLTGRERSLLNHLGEGLSNREIAERMYLSEKTVKNYMSQLLSKLGMRSRTQAALYVTTRGSAPNARADVPTAKYKSGALEDFGDQSQPAVSGPHPMPPAVEAQPRVKAVLMPPQTFWG